jgi:hypothetical protein
MLMVTSLTIELFASSFHHLQNFPLLPTAAA